jgi:N-acetylglucosaminyldiphosphoundecaprenol N-acetyl-beta-D-mannosaminyltransferase
MRPGAGYGYRLGKRGLDLCLASLLAGICLPLRLCGLAGPRPLALLAAIVRGRLSFVGPRTVLPTDRALPGLVCLWWLRCRSNIAYGSEREADQQYLDGRSVCADLAILLRALPAWLYGAPASGHAACIHIGGVRLLNLRAEELLDAVMLAVQRGQPTRIAFANPDCINIAARDPLYRRDLAGFDWVCADGIGMKFAGRLLGREVRQNVNGTDFFPALCAALAASGQTLYLLGARPGVAEAAAQWAQAHFPGLRIAGTHHGYFGASEEVALIASIAALRPAVLLLALGAPRQERWLQCHLDASGCTVGIGVGGLFDFYAGRIARAPLWLREIGGEWLFRLLKEPARMWRRYLLGNVVFLVRILVEKLRSPKAKGE